MTPEQSPPTLDYHSAPAPRRPSALLAIGLCLPGLLCWPFFIFNDVDTWPAFTQFVNWLGLTFTHIAILWIIAIVAALFSLIYYAIRWRQPKPWYVIVCLVANSIGLVFSVLVLFA